MGGGYAWVTLATNDSYSLGALVLAHSLKQVGTGHQLAVLVTPGVTNAMREKLASVFNLVQEVNILDSRDERNLRLLKRPELGITFTKLHCWRLTQFDKCVFLDADTLVLQNCDELFNREELSAAPDVGWPDCFNSGVFVYRPSNETYESLVQFALEKGSFDGGDQGLLNLYFSDWATKDISKHLPFIYNLCSTACYSYAPAFKQFGLDAKIIHFIGASKPWLQYFNTETRTVQPSHELKHLQGALQYWWNIFCSVIHPQLTMEMSGLAGAFAQLTLGAPRTPEQSALDDHLRRQGWETGNIDYMGRDSFDNIWSKICETLSAGLPASPPEITAEPTTSTPTGHVEEIRATEASLDLSEVPSSTQDSTIPSSFTPSETSKTVSETGQDSLEQPKTVAEEKNIVEDVSAQSQVDVAPETDISAKAAVLIPETEIPQSSVTTEAVQETPKVQDVAVEEVKALSPTSAAEEASLPTTQTPTVPTSVSATESKEAVPELVKSTEPISSSLEKTSSIEEPSPLICTRPPSIKPTVSEGSSSPKAETEPTVPQEPESPSVPKQPTPSPVSTGTPVPSEIPSPTETKAPSTVPSESKPPGTPKSTDVALATITKPSKVATAPVTPASVTATESPKETVPKSTTAAAVVKPAESTRIAPPSKPVTPESPKTKSVATAAVTPSSVSATESPKEVVPESTAPAAVVKPVKTVTSASKPTTPESPTPALESESSTKQVAAAESSTPASDVKTTDSGAAAPATVKSKTGTEATKPKVKAEKTESASTATGASPTPPPRKAGTAGKKIKTKK